jgi:hypothetical protein
MSKRGRVLGAGRRRFDFAAKRRREIVLHARHVGAADSEDFTRWLIAWVWHNPKAKDQIWSVMNAARNMGREITEAEASAVTEEASITRKRLTADNLARFLGMTYQHRQALRLTTIGSVNVGKRARKELHKLRARKALAAKRRATGVLARAEYEANSIAAVARTEGVSRMTIYRRRRAEQAKNQPNVTGVSTPIFLSSVDRPVTPAGVKPLPSEASPRRKQATAVLQTADTPAVDGLASANSTAAKRFVLSSDPTAFRVWHGYTKVPLALRPWGSFPREFWRARQIVAAAERAGRAA